MSIKLPLVMAAARPVTEHPGVAVPVLVVHVAVVLAMLPVGPARTVNTSGTVTEPSAVEVIVKLLIVPVVGMVLVLPASAVFIVPLFVALMKP